MFVKKPRKSSIAMRGRGGAFRLPIFNYLLAALLFCGMAVPGGAQGESRQKNGDTVNSQLSDRRQGASVSSPFPFLERMVNDQESLGQHGVAVDYQKKLVARLSGRKGIDHPLVLRTRSRLSRLLVAEGRLDEGRSVLEKLENDLLLLLGEHHFETALVRLNRARVSLFWRDRSGEALKLVDAALPVFARTLWPDHPLRMDALIIRGKALSALGRGVEAEKAFAVAMTHCTTYFGTADVHMAEVLAEMGWNRILLGRFQEGTGDLEQALVFYENTGLPPSGNDHIHTLGRLAEGYLRWGKQAEARVVLEKTVMAMEVKHGTDHSALAKPLTDLGMVDLALGQLDRAEVNLKRALGLAQAHHAPDHPQRAFILTNLGELFWHQGKKVDADRSFSEAESAAVAFFGTDSVGLANWLASMAVILHQGGNEQQASALFAKSLLLLETALGPKDPAVEQVRESLRRLPKAGLEKTSATTSKNEIFTGQTTAKGFPTTTATPDVSARPSEPAQPQPLARRPALGRGQGVGTVAQKEFRISSDGIHVAKGGETDLALPELVIGRLGPDSALKIEVEDKKETQPEQGGVQTQGWIVHLACRSDLDVEGRQIVKAMARLDIPVYQRMETNKARREVCFFSGPYRQRQEATAIAQRIAFGINLNELEVRAYEPR